MLTRSLLTRRQILAGVISLTSFAALAGVAAAEVPTASQLVAIENEPAPKLIVDQPLPGPLARGAALIPYRVENFRILPILGAAATNVSPRVGHLHVTVDDLPWRWGDFSNTNTIVVTGLPAGEHKIRIELSDPEHRIFTGQTVTFTVLGAPVAGPAPHVH